MLISDCVKIRIISELSSWHVIHIWCTVCPFDCFKGVFNSHTLIWNNLSWHLICEYVSRLVLFLCYFSWRAAFCVKAVQLNKEKECSNEKCDNEAIIYIHV